MSVTKHATNPDRWRIQVYARRPDGRETRRTRVIEAPHTREGKRIAERAKLDLQDELAANPISATTGAPARTVAELLDAWVDARSPTWSIKHRANVAWWNKNHLKPRFGHLALDQVNARLLEQFYSELLASGGRNGQPLEPATVAHAHRRLRAAFNVAVDWDWIATNPVKRATPPKIRRKHINIPSIGQIETADRAVADNPHWSAYLRVAYTTGARRSQILGLTWEDIDHHAETIRFEWSHTAAGGQTETKGTKNDQAYPVTTDHVTLGRLKLLHEWQTDRAEQLAVPVGPALFSWDAGHTRTHPDSIDTWWQRLRERNPQVASIELHDLRHLPPLQRRRRPHRRRPPRPQRPNRHPPRLRPLHRRERPPRRRPPRRHRHLTTRVRARVTATE